MKQQGLSLIEVMIALAVLTIGLFGLAALQMSSLQYVHSSHYRSLASTIATDFEERLWLTLADNSLTGCPEAGDEEGTPAADLLESWTRVNTGEDWAWSSARMLRIPDLTLVTGTPVVGGSVILIPLTFSWTETRFDDNESTTEQFTYNVRIQCRPV